MKKKLLIAMAVLGLGLVILIAGGSGDEPLDPSVVRDLVFTVPDVAPADNIYIGVFGIGGLRYGDVVIAGEKYSKHGYPHAEGLPEDELFDRSYVNPCLSPDADNCLDQIVSESADIEAAVAKNRQLIDRYRIVQKMPLFVDTASDMVDPVPQYSYLIDSTRLISAQALLAAKRGDVSAGLAAVETELDFYRKIYQSEHISLIDLMISVAAVNINLITLKTIIADGAIDLSGQEDRLRKMLELDLDSGRATVAALTSEKRMLLRNLAPGKWEGSPFGPEEGPLAGLGEKIFPYIFKNNMTLNMIAARLDEEIGAIRDRPLLNFPEFYAERAAKMQSGPPESGPSVKRLFKTYGIFFFKNYGGEIFIEMIHQDYLRYAAKVKDQLVFSRLIRTQLELRLMPDRPGSISEALATLGPESFNPYTGAPFNWDQERNSIWAEQAAKSHVASGREVRFEAKVPPIKP